MVKEIIEKFVKINNDDLGYEIHTNQQVIKVVIDNCGNCCERWGFLTTEDTLKDFEGAELISLAVVDEKLKTHPLTKNAKELEWCDEEAAVCFVDVNTSNGKLQFAIYNMHNGYYGHQVRISSNQLTFEKTL